MVTSIWPLAHSAPYLPGRPSATAVPPYISGRTSYLRVRLAFHLYPQVIPQFCNTGGFGPRQGLTPASPCPWIAHSVSGLIHATPLALFRLAFAPAPPLYRGLTSPTRVGGCAHELAGSFYKRHAVRRHPVTWTHLPPTACKCRGSGSLSFPSRGAFHLSLTVLVHYRWPSVFSLGGWSPQLPTGLHVSRGTQVHSTRPTPSPTGLSPAPAQLPSCFGCPVRLISHSYPPCPTTPQQVPPSRFGLLPVRSPLLRESRLISLPRGTEMFQFPRCPSLRLCIQRRMSALARRRVAPFGFDWLIARCSSPVTFRRSPRPSSALGPTGIRPALFSAWLAITRLRLHATRMPCYIASH